MDVRGWLSWVPGTVWLAVAFVLVGWWAGDASVFWIVWVCLAVALGQLVLRFKRRTDEPPV